MLCDEKVEEKLDESKSSFHHILIASVAPTFRYLSLALDEFLSMSILIVFEQLFNFASVHTQTHF